MFAINPRQCSGCDTLTCTNCANLDHEDPHLCKSCLRNGIYNSVLRKPNDLKGNVLILRREVASFDCPYRCGTINMSFEQIQAHTFSSCELRPLESMPEVKVRPEALKKP